MSRKPTLSSSLIAGASLACIVFIILRFVPAVSSRSARLEQDLDQHFLAYEFLQLNTSSVFQQVKNTTRLSLATSNLSFDLELAPHDLRAPGYRAEVFGADGIGQIIDIGPVKTFRGRARGAQNGAPFPQLGEARFTIDEGIVEGLIITPTEHYFIEPARNFSDEATTSEYVIYKESDVITNSTGDCGVTLSEQVNQKAGSIDAVAELEDPKQSGAAAGLQELRIATEADNEYVTSKGGAVAADQEILGILNKVEGLYEVELGLTMKVVYQSVWSTANDPFSSTNPTALLGELSNHWNQNRGSVARDVVHMFTGKTLDNFTFGTAYLEALCRFTSGGRAAYGLSKGIVDDGQQVAVTSHEIAHNLGATHPNQQVPPIAECAGTVMNSSVNENPKLTFCISSRDEIAKFLSSNLGCLGTGTTALQFAVSNPFSIGGDPAEVITADFNGDGKSDMATANGGGSVSVLLGADNGQFQTPTGSPFPAGSLPRALTHGDFNGDGNIDLAITNFGSNDVSVLIGIGDGRFNPGTGSPFPAGVAPASITAGDFNNDGILDLGVANSTGVTVLRGQGAGIFQNVATHATGTSPSSVKTADFNRDGYGDLAVANAGSSNVSVLLSNGETGFNLSTHYMTGVSPQSIAVGFFNSDDIVDLAIANRLSSELSILIGRGDGTFFTPNTPVIFYQPGSSLTSLTAADFNGDGKQDLAISIEGRAGFSSPTGSISVRMGQGGSFSPETRILANGIPKKLSHGDFNGDGKIDLVAAIDGELNTLLGNGDGSFQAVTTYRMGEEPRALVTGDFNKDGNPDLAALDRNSDFDDMISVLLGRGDGTFIGAGFVQPSSSNYGKMFTVGDFNGDHALDLASAGASDGLNNIFVFLGNNTGRFPSPSFKFRAGGDAIRITSADFNRDNRSDLAVTSAGSNDLSLFLSTTTGIFQNPISFPTNGASTSLATGDFNDDQKVDLITTGKIMLGNGDGTFIIIDNSEIGGFPGDFDGDGHLDLMTSSKYLRGNGDGTFQIKSGPGFGSLGMPFDFNGDGKLDQAFTSGDTVNIALGNGDGTFQSTTVLRLHVSLVGLVAADLNHDGKLDLATSTRLIQAVSFLGLAGVLQNIGGQTLDRPVNDDFGKARVIVGPNGTLPGSTVLATKEVGENDHTGGPNGTVGASIWYRWTAPTTGRFYFQTFSSSFPNVLAVYTGTSVAALTNVVRSTTVVPEYVEFNATAGTTYHIAIDGLTGDTGRTVLNWNTGSLSNDNFAFAREIRGSSGSVNGDNTNFTLEPGEPILPGVSGSNFSAWYRWTAPNTGKVSFLATPRAPTPCGDTTRLLGAYTGNFINSLTQVAVNFDGYRDFDDPGGCDNRSLRFNAIAGVTYRIQLRSVTGKPFTLSWNYANPPPNDNFTNALILAGASGSLIGTNRDATKEAGEPNHAGGQGGASIWYRWTAPSSGPVTFDTIGFRNQTANSFRYLTALIAIYTGSNLHTLTSVATSATDNKVTFNATAGTTYQIAIDSAPYSGGGYLPGIVPLHWGAKQIANDDFVNAQPLTTSGSFVPLLGSNVSATKETGEPNHQASTGGASVWYRWTALGTGNVSFILNPCITCSLSTTNALVSVYTGANVNALTLVPSSADNNHTFAAVRGTTYFIAVDSRTANGGTYEFSLVSANISARNDAFVNAQVLSGTAGAVAGDNSGASREIAEPDHANDIGGASVWYQWTAPASGLYTFDTFGSNFDTLLAVYTGNTVSALTVVANSDNAGSSPQSRLTFDAKVDTTYFIVVDGKSNGVEQGTGIRRSQAGFILLNWNNLPPPVNDNFASAQAITGASGNVTGRNLVASKEGGELNHAGGPGGASVWYKWTAPSSGNFTFNTFGSDFNTLLGVYTGSAVSALTVVSSNDDVGGSRQSRVTINATTGTLYYIAVDGSVGVPGNITTFSGNVVLSWFPETGVSNNNFVLAQPLSGASGSLAATNAGATREANEPSHAGDRGGRSVWYSWTAPFTGPVLFTTAGSDFDTVLAVYTGVNVSQLTPLASNDDSPYSDNLGHILTSSLTFNATTGTTYRIAVDGSGGRFGNFALRWGPEAKIGGQVSFVGGFCGSDKKVTILLSGEDARAVTLNSSGTYSFQHLRVGGNYSVRGVSEISDTCLPLFLERAQNYFPLAGDVLDANFIDDGLRGGGSTSTISGRVKNAAGVGLHNVTIDLSGTVPDTRYTDNAGYYQLRDLPPGTYKVRPSKPGLVFNPLFLEFTFTSGQQRTGIDFVSQDSFSISGQTRDQNGAPLSSVTITLNNGTEPVSVQTDENGHYSFDAMAGASYTLKAAKTGLNFTPEIKSIPPLTSNQKNIDFTVTQLFTLSIRSTNPGTGVPITVSPIDGNGQAGGSTEFTRSYNADMTVNLTAPATAGGNVFQKWLQDGADISTILSTDVKMDSDHTLTAVYVTPPPLLQLLLEESDASLTQVAALDAVLLLRDPFPVLNLNNLLNAGTDRNTRVLVFVKNLQLQAGETAAVVKVNLVDSSGHSHDIDAESLIPLVEFSQLTFRLPDGLPPGECAVQIKAHGQVSNTGVIRIKP